MYEPFYFAIIKNRWQWYLSPVFLWKHYLLDVKLEELSHWIIILRGANISFQNSMYMISRRYLQTAKKWMHPKTQVKKILCIRNLYFLVTLNKGCTLVLALVNVANLKPFFCNFVSILWYQYSTAFLII